METIMAKKPLNLDFSDISGGIKKKTTDKREVEKIEKDPDLSKAKLTGITLVVAQDGQSAEKDLAECSDEEFLSWCYTVLPQDFPLKDSQVEGLEGKIKVFKAIVGLGKRSLFSRKRATVGNFNN